MSAVKDSAAGAACPLASAMAAAIVVQMEKDKQSDDTRRQTRCPQAATSDDTLRHKGQLQYCRSRGGGWGKPTVPQQQRALLHQ